jgi:hypothetical protein
MNSRALTLAVRLLTTACVGAALGSLPACPFFGCGDPWSEVENLELGTNANLLAAAHTASNGFVLVGVGGVVVHVDSAGESSLSNPTNVTLRGVIGDSPTYAVGDGGTILRSDDHGESWTALSSGVSDDLLAIADAQLEDGRFLVAIAAEQVLYSTDEGETWIAAAPPAAGWGGLRAVFATHDEIHVLGAAGLVWVTQNPAGAWLRRDVDTPDDLIGGGPVSGHADHGRVAVATASQVFHRGADDSQWIASTSDLDGALAAYGSGFVVTVNGTVYDVISSGALERITNVGLTPRALAGGRWSGFLVAGDAGKAARVHYYECVGGRPWIVDGELATAALRWGPSAWAEPSGAEPSGAEPSGVGQLHEPLAAAWARDGLLEHASVASFARAMLELMSLGAPAELLLAYREAIVDELEHAQRCFSLASRHAHAPVGPGPLPLARAGDRAGDPAAIALAVFDEGCINESIAAAEAAVAAAGCRDPRARATLERIAADERRHAALAWQTLRWLLDAHGPVVAPALRGRLAVLGAPPLPAESESEATEHGRLPARERAAIHREVLATLVAPLAHALLDPGQVITA